MQKNFDTVYGEYLGSYQKRIMRTIRDDCKLQSDGKIDEALKLYDAAITEAFANDAVGIHYFKAILAEGRDDKVQATQEYLAFVKDADIIYYGAEIIVALDRIVELEEAN